MKGVSAPADTVLFPLVTIRRTGIGIYSGGAPPDEVVVVVAVVILVELAESAELGAGVSPIVISDFMSAYVLGPIPLTF